MFLVVFGCNFCYAVFRDVDVVLVKGNGIQESIVSLGVCGDEIEEYS